MLNCGIKGIGIYAPQTRTASHELLNQHGFGSDEPIREIGFFEKPVLSRNEKIISLSESALINLLTSLDSPLPKIDLLIHCGSGAQDYSFWSPASHLLDFLKQKSSFGFDLAHGCNAGNLGMFTAVNWLERENSWENAIVVASDALSWRVDYSKKENFPIFSWSDGASAILISKNHKRMRLCSYFAITQPQFSRSMWAHGQTGTVEMDVSELTETNLGSAYREMYPSVIKGALDRAGLVKQNIDYLFLNQGSPRLLDFLCNQFDLNRERVQRTYSNYGHMGPSDIFLGLKSAMDNGLLKNGDNVVLASSSYGYSWSASVIKI